MTDQASVMLAAGGTGGHLFPAFALAEELQRRGRAVDLMTDMRGDRYGSGFPARDVYRVPSATLASRSAKGVVKTGATLTRGTAAAFRILRRVRPGVVLGFGGYPSYPPLLAARLLRIPTALHEQNAVLGRANRLLARGVDAIATSFDVVKHLSGDMKEKTVMTGNPVRHAVIEAAQQNYVAPDADRDIRILVFGGSQGAHFFSDVATAAFIALPDSIRQRLEITQQARSEDLQTVIEQYTRNHIAADVAAFFDDLPARMARAHLVIGRAGASTVAELTVMGRPSLLVPLPHAIDNDQLNNARHLETVGGAWCLEQKSLTAERLADEIDRLVRAPAVLEAAAKAAKTAGRPQAVSALADFVEALCRGENPGFS